MTHSNYSFLRRVFTCQSGQTLVYAAVMIPLILGMGGVVVDVGHGYACYRQLQSSTDAAALAGAKLLPNVAQAEVVATQYSSVATNYNAFPSLNTPLAITGAQISFYPYCVSTIPKVPSCGGTLTTNALRVTQTVTIPTYFIRALAFLGVNSARSMTLTAQSTAVGVGGSTYPENIAVIFDTTGSMNTTDGGHSCSGTKEQCSLQGAQVMLSAMSPCASNLAACGTVTNGNVASPYDEVAAFTFPARPAGTQATHDYACPSVQNATIDYPDSTANVASPLTAAVSSTQLTNLTGSYMLLPLSSDYRTTDNLAVAPSPLTTSSNVVKLVGGNSYWGGATNNCNGMQYIRNYTYFAGALYTAQQYLMAHQNDLGRTNIKNIIVILSDGDANAGTSHMSAGASHLNSNGTYPSGTKMCQQAIDVATAAKANGTEIYVVGYNVTSGGCNLTSDVGLTACQTLTQMASPDTSGKHHFYTDSSSTACSGTLVVGPDGKQNSLAAIFTAIVDDLSKPKLIPNGAS